MATSKPYSYPTHERVDRVDTLLGGARALLKSSGDINDDGNEPERAVGALVTM